MPSSAYEVEAGDSLWTIAQKTGVDWATLVASYGGSNPNLIRAGEKIKLPSGRASENIRAAAIGWANSSPKAGAPDNLIQSNFVPEVATRGRAPDVINLVPHGAARAREDTSPALRTTQYPQLTPGGRPVFGTIRQAAVPSTAKAKAKAREAVSPLRPGVTYAERMAAYSRAFGAAASGAVGGIQTILSGAAGALPEPQETKTQKTNKAIGSIS